METAGQEEPSISNMQENRQPSDLLHVLQGGTTKPSNQENQNREPVPGPVVYLDLELSLGGNYSGEGGSLPRSLSSSSSTNSMVGVQSNAREAIVGGANGAADLPFMGPLVSLERSCSLPHEGEREARKVIWSVLAKRRIDSTKRFVMQRKARIASQADKKNNRSATEPMPKLLGSRSEGDPRAASALKCISISEPLHVQSLRKRSLPQDMMSAKGLQLSLAKKNEAASSELLPKLNETFSKVISTMKAKGKQVSMTQKAAESPCKKPRAPKNRFEYNGIDVMKLMPSVVTTGDGPGSRTVEGILYKYTRQSVTIVCVCHGAFFSPEEFVSHSGRTDSQNPMKHIKVVSE